MKCENCGKESILPIVLTFDYYFNKCPKCLRTDIVGLSYNFCSLKCLYEWITQNDIVEKGFECPICKGEKGFKDCKYCKGMGYIKDSIID